MSSALPQTHRTLDPEEILYLIVVDQFKPSRSRPHMRVTEVDALLLPHACNEKFIRDAGYLAEAKDPRGKPIRNTVRVTPEGRAAIRQYIRLTIAKAQNDLQAARAQGRMSARALELQQALIERLQAHLDAYQPLQPDEEYDYIQDDPPPRPTPRQVKPRNPNARILKAAASDADDEPPANPIRRPPTRRR